MALFRRSPKPAAATPPAADDLATLLLEGEDMLDRLAAAHRDRWGAGSADSWAVDLSAGTIAWTFADKRVVAPVQILGSYVQSSGSWRWAWSNEGIPVRVRADADRLRSWGEAGGHAAFTAAELQVDEQTAMTLAAIAVRVTRATGFYRGDHGAIPYMTFGAVTIEPNDGAPSTFTVSIPA
ncbi:hypothetical protein CWIS_06675 [Cellulomonas sp. A375-1]|uniref:DUF6882 domain-containing protein n=1 Tax=Cellulomonas sp. A375-1 TaxID=1672219 RepID=UPI0006527E05|nr:DUF6882 domain-containing protein [Cellulomonas sp. A375-1]KMM46156.1 hypothetical protein CWIS_06675 [Cellulomonas sp. A375-1]